MKNIPVEEAVRIALTQVVGAYAIIVLSEDQPERSSLHAKAAPW